MLFIGFKWIVFTNELDGVDPVDNIESMGCQESKFSSISGKNVRQLKESKLYLSVCVFAFITQRH